MWRLCLTTSPITSRKSTSGPGRSCTSSETGRAPYTLSRRVAYLWRATSTGLKGKLQ
eukprot:jgi/Botrbrau1/4608/Bobra.60_2s0093.1